MFRIFLEIKPTSTTDVDIDIEGAFVTCWVNLDELKEARQRAIQCVEEEGWVVIGEEGFQEIIPEFLERHTESYTIYQAALREGCILVFYPWLSQRSGREGFSDTD